MVNKVATLSYLPGSTGFDSDDARFLADNGFNVVRLGIIWKGLEPQPGVYDERYLDGIESSYEILQDYGISVLLDFHQDLYNERFQGEGAPDWAVLGQAATEDPTPQVGFPQNYVLQAAVNHAFDAFWANNVVPGTGQGVQDFYAKAWAHVAERFRGKPGIVGYNLFNEPWAGSPFRQCLLMGRMTTTTSCGVQAFEASTLTAFHSRVTQAIRGVDQQTMVFAAPMVSFDGGTPAGVGKVDDRAGFAFNAYCTAEQLAAVYRFAAGKSCAEQAGPTIQNALDESARNGDALFMTEFGATDNQPEFSDYLRAANENGISWTYWAYCGCGDPTTAAVPPDLQAIVVNPGAAPGDSAKTAKLAVLAQPYAAVVAGTPGASSYDATTATFSFQYTARPIGGGKKFKPGSVTELEIPAVQYPTGYRVSVRGAEVKSKPRSRLLRLARCRGGLVSVTVTQGRTPARVRHCPGEGKRR
jgi:endoglycosylceramidase